MPTYFTPDKAWRAQLCPVCRRKVAVERSVLYAEPAPELGTDDERQPIREAFSHRKGEDCLRPPDEP